MIEKIRITTNGHSEFVDITARVRDIVRNSGKRSGICRIYTPHTTTGITINEHADPDVVADMIDALDRIVPWRGAWRHAEGNSAAHIKASMMGSSQQVFFEEGELALGTWQGIFFAEFDGPRRREVWVKITPDK